MDAQFARELPQAPIAGKYDVRGVLGEGGTGIVYDAVRIDDQTAVALKVIHPHLAGDRQVRGRFEREALILRRLEGDHICPILELGEVPREDGTSLLYMALPKLTGPTLEEVLRAESPISVERGLDVVLEICAALRAAHAHGIIHRDLKPANVILESGKRAVVVDFGMSKIVTGASSGLTDLTAHNMVFGTPEYMSPEQARGDELDARCDIYAVGVILYEMFTGKTPFTGTTPLNVLTEHLTGELVPPSARAEVGRMTPALESVVLHALARNRDERYLSATALAAAIVHARAVPDDVDSLKPAAFEDMPRHADAFALTSPEIGLAPMYPPPGDAEDDAMPSDTLLASVPPTPITAPPPPSAPAPLAAPERRRTRIVANRDNTRTWVLLWVVAAIASIAIGVYFALR